MGAVFGSNLGPLESNLESVLEGVGVDRRTELLAHLEAMERRKIRLRHVAVWREAFLGGAADHHTLVYEYLSQGYQMSLKIDWGREGVTFKDSSDDPCPKGDIIHRKWCRLRPSQLRDQLLAVLDREYVLTSWNCQHFSDHFFLAATEETDVVAASRPVVVIGGETGVG